MTQPWRQKTIALPFRLGELQLFSVKFLALVKMDNLQVSKAGSPVPLNRLHTSIKAIVTGSDPVESSLPRVTMLKQAIRYVPRQYRRFYIDLAGSFADYQKHFSRKRRGNLRREARVFARTSGGQLHWRTFRKPDEIAEFHRHASEISRQTYQHRLWEKGIPQSKEFASHLNQSASRDEARGYLLYFQNQPQAYAYFEAQQNVLQFHYTGYNPDLRQYSPGSVLLYAIVEQLFAQNEFALLDFTEGEAWYKQSFATNHVRCADIYYFRKNWFGATTVAAHCAVASLSRSTARVAEKLRLYLGEVPDIQKISRSNLSTKKRLTFNIHRHLPNALFPALSFLTRRPIDRMLLYSQPRIAKILNCPINSISTYSGPKLLLNPLDRSHFVIQKPR